MLDVQAKDIIALDGATTLEELFEKLLNALEEFGIVYAFYGICVRREPGEPIFWGYFGNYPAEMREAYISDGLINDDPTLERFLRDQDMRPVLWTEPNDPAYERSISPGQLRVERLAWKYGLVNGATIPLSLTRASTTPHSAAGICCSRDISASQWKSIWADNALRIMSLLETFDKKAQSIPDVKYELDVAKDSGPNFYDIFDLIKYNDNPRTLNKAKEAISKDLADTAPERRLERALELARHVRDEIAHYIPGSPLLVEMDLSVNPLPEGKELYEDRKPQARDDGTYGKESPIEFAERVWGDWREPDGRWPAYWLAQRDPKLVKAIRGLCHRKRIDYDRYLVTKTEKIDGVLTSPEVRRFSTRTNSARLYRRK